MRGHARFHLQGSPELLVLGRKQTKISKWKYMSPPGIEPTTLLSNRNLIRVTIGTNKYLCLKLFQNSIMKNKWQYINIWLWIIVIQEVLWSIRGSCWAIWSNPLTNVKWHSDPWPTVTSLPIRLSTNFMTFIPSLTFTELWVVSMEHLQRVWLANRERLPFRTPGSVPHFGTC